MAAQNNNFPINVGKSVLASIFGFLVLYIILIFFMFVFLFIFPIVSGVISFLLAGLTFIMFISLLFSYLYINSLSYEVTDQHFILRGGVLGKFEKILPYSRLQHVVLSETWAQRFFGISTLVIQNAGQEIIMQGKNAVLDIPAIPGLFREDALKLRNFLIVEILKTKSGSGL